MYKVEKEYTDTCSLLKPRDGCMTFIRDLSYLHLLDKCKEFDVIIYAPKNMRNCLNLDKSLNICFVDDPDYEFTVTHNEINKSRMKLDIQSVFIGNNCRIHPKAVLGVEGFKFANCPDGSKVQFIHVGNVVIGNNVEIGAHAIVHRAAMDSTIIKNGVKIAVQSNVGHNCYIGKNTVIAGAVHICGSVTIGKNCWIGATTAIKNGVSICDNVIIGMGSLVMKNIEKPGIYFGRPAKYQKPYEGGYNF